MMVLAAIATASIIAIRRRSPEAVYRRQRRRDQSRQATLRKDSAES
jgi:hypothetical protein